MKFWGFTSVLRGFEKHLDGVLSADKSKIPYGEWFSSFDALVDAQDRES